MGKGGEKEGRRGEGKGGQGRGNLFAPPPKNIFGLTPLVIWELE